MQEHFEDKNQHVTLMVIWNIGTVEFAISITQTKDLTQEISKRKYYYKALGHNYVDGKCTVCGMADPNYNQGQVTPSQPDNTEEQDQ